MIATVLHLNERAGAPLDAVNSVRPHCLHRHDVGHVDLLARRPAFGVELFFVADDAVDFRHRRENLCFGLRSTASDNDTGIRSLALETAYGLPGLTHRFRGHRAGIHHNRAVNAGSGCGPSNDFRLVGVQSAAEGDDVDAHDAPAFAKSVGSKRPLNSNSTGPVIST